MKLLADALYTVLYARTHLLELGFVAFALNNRLFLSLGLGRFGLEGGNPAITLDGAVGLESVLLAVQLEVQLVGSILDDIRDIGLYRLVLCRGE